jgi:RNA polymerase sigma-70 factor (ECF subfamily)
MNERLLRRSISLSFPAATCRRVNAVGADSPEGPDRFDPLEPSARRERISDAVNRQLAHLSDEALVALAARSEQSALAELYDRYGRTAYGLALRILRDQTLAEDAVQEAFLAVWRTASRFVPERGRASTWILTLVHRRAVDAVRREQRRRADSLERADEPSVEGVEEDAWLRFQRERVQAALSRLPDAQREALELAYYGGFSQSELAERLGQPLGTIKSRMFGGLSRMRELLGDAGTETSWTHTT